MSTMTEAEADAVFADLEGDAAVEGFGFDGMSEEQVDRRITTEYPGQLPQKVAGKMVTIYDTRTGEPSAVLPYMLKKLFRDFKHEDGTPMYSRHQLVQPVAGTMKCLLNAGSPARAYYDEIGLATKACSKVNLRSQFDVEQHMQMRHKSEWGMAKRAEAKAIEDEEREFRRVQMEYMRAQTPAKKAG